jgi:hypothetical protein
VDFKSLGGPVWQIVTSTMVSRLVLNLRTAASNDDVVFQNPTMFDTTTRIVNITLGNLGEELEMSFRSGDLPMFGNQLDSGDHQLTTYRSNR